ncbi:MAG TPA: RIO1 family regulatory kinase/ATPase [Acidimicrobiales bacterium]|nr:RIO1 family regulatory kinase/ATPase [Acidimicrobiales bacterium]
MHPVPDWLPREPFAEIDLGTLKTGKEAQIEVVERTDDDGRSCLLARKRYIPRGVKQKGVLEAMGLQRASTFTHDVQYREGRQFRKSRDRRAVERMSTHGKRLLQDRWTNHEHDVMARLWAAGVRVPYPVSFAEDVFVLEYIGARDGAAPQLAGARLGAPSLASAWEQLIDGLRAITAAGIAHADLSAYNLLWWEDELWFIDFPQAVDLAANPSGLDFLHRDVQNVCEWFSRRGVVNDPEEVFADLVGYAFG